VFTSASNTAPRHTLAEGQAVGDEVVAKSVAVSNARISTRKIF
jgi:hypothetical protein